MLIIIFMVNQTLQLGQLNKDISTPDLIRVKRVFYVLIGMTNTSCYGCPHINSDDNDVVTYHNIGVHFDNLIFQICIASRDMCQQMGF